MSLEPKKLYLPLYCSFCGKERRDVAYLVAGPTVYICNECVELCREIGHHELTVAGATPGGNDMDATEQQQTTDAAIEDHHERLAKLGIVIVNDRPYLAPPTPPFRVDTLTKEQYQALPRAQVSIRRREDVRGMAWLEDGWRIAFNTSMMHCFRVEGVVDVDGNPIYEPNFGNSCSLKPPAK